MKWPHLLYTQQKQGEYVVTASDGINTYVVTITDSLCSAKSTCVPQCTALECLYLCRRQIRCTCWDYQEGHLCKHCHKVKTTTNSAHINQKCISNPQPATYTFNPWFNKRDHAGQFITVCVHRYYCYNYMSSIMHY